jgi:hypothetical protein
MTIDFKLKFIYLSKIVIIIDKKCFFLINCLIESKIMTIIDNKNVFFSN